MSSLQPLILYSYLRTRYRRRFRTRAELLASPEDESFRLPRRDSIARRLVEEWLADRA